MAKQHFAAPISAGGAGRELTQEEYNALSESSKNNGTTYYVSDANNIDTSNLIQFVQKNDWYGTVETKSPGFPYLTLKPMNGSVSVPLGESAVGKTYQITPYINDVEIDPKLVTWTSLNTNVATVSESGLVTVLRNNTGVDIEAQASFGVNNRTNVAKHHLLISHDSELT